MVAGQPNDIRNAISGAEKELSTKVLASIIPGFAGSTAGAAGTNGKTLNGGDQQVALDEAALNPLLLGQQILVNAAAVAATSILHVFE